MGYVTVTGGDRKLKELTHKAACFAINKLFPRARKYDIKIKLGSKYDDCFEYDDRYYKININKNQERDDFLTAIFHELTHVKQYIYDNLLGTYYFTYHEGGMVLLEDYINHPAEKEAYKMQEILLKDWKIKYGITI